MLNKLKFTLITGFLGLVILTTAGVSTVSAQTQSAQKRCYNIAWMGFDIARYFGYTYQEAVDIYDEVYGNCIFSYLPTVAKASPVSKPQIFLEELSIFKEEEFI